MAKQGNASLWYTPSVPSTNDPQTIFATQLSQLEITLQDAASIDAKSLAVVATDIALMIFMAEMPPAFSLWSYLPFALSFILATINVIPLHYIGPGITPQQVLSYLQMDEQGRTIQFISNFTNAIKKNTSLNDRRWRVCLAAIVLEAVGLVGLLIYYIQR